MIRTYTEQPTTLTTYLWDGEEDLNKSFYELIKGVYTDYGITTYASGKKVLTLYSAKGECVVFPNDFICIEYSSRGDNKIYVTSSIAEFWTSDEKKTTPAEENWTLYLIPRFRIEVQLGRIKPGYGKFLDDYGRQVLYVDTSTSCYLDNFSLETFVKLDKVNEPRAATHVIWKEQL